MTTKLNCSVCGYTEIDSNICPNCATDLSLIWMLQQLPQARVGEGSQRCVEVPSVEATGVERGEGEKEIASVILQWFGSKEYFFQDLLGAVSNRFAQGRKQKGLVKIAAWLGVTLFILTVGIALGVVGVCCASF